MTGPQPAPGAGVPARGSEAGGPDFWSGLRASTQARIGLGRAGNALPTAAELEFRAAHADARDAVHDELDVDELAGRLAGLGLGEPVTVRSRAADRAEFLRRPDLGREPATDVRLDAPGLVVVCADGLSARAVSGHAVGLLEALLPRLSLAVGPPVVATHARVALADHVAAGARAVLVLIGERPGLSATDSLGAYLTWAPRPGRSDAERNCVSNIRPPLGLGYEQAARVIAALLVEAARLGESGVRVKDRSRVEIGPKPGRNAI